MQGYECQVAVEKYESYFLNNDTGVNRALIFMIRNLQRFMQLSKADKQLIVKVWLLLWKVRLMLWVVSYRVTRNWLENRASAGINGSVDMNYAHKIVRFVTITRRFVPQSSCLAQALAAENLLRKFGFNPSLHIGVKKMGESDFEAHAWLELNSVKLIGGSAAEGFKRIYRV